MAVPSCMSGRTEPRHREVEIKAFRGRQHGRRGGMSAGSSATLALPTDRARPVTKQSLALIESEEDMSSSTPFTERTADTADPELPPLRPQSPVAPTPAPGVLGEPLRPAAAEGFT
ncbi:MAG: hypothetical protein RMJ52_08570, partial [Gemmataceae bacterium]|nr:hypothetical protein [Gemmataceae bacterium]